MNEKLIAAMLTPAVEIDEKLSWGLGWGLERASGGDFFWHWGDNEVFKAFALGSRKTGDGLVVLTNSANGLEVCREIVRNVFPGEHPALNFRLLNY